jgi:hypothetical protein
MRASKKMLQTLGVSFCLIVCFIAASLAFPPTAHAQALEPRLYSNIPTRMNFLVLGYGYSQGDVLIDPTLPIEDLNARIHLPILAYVRSLNVWGQSGKFDIVLPFAWLSGSGKIEGEDKARKRSVTGFGDPMVRFTVNLSGAPALPLKEFMSYRQKTIVGVSFQVSAPLGQYDPSKLGNIGTNRWMFKPEIGISHATGRWHFEASTAMNFYSTNDNFLGGSVRKQDSILSIQGHAIYSFRQGAWTALDITYYNGGRTTVDDVVRKDLQTNWRIGATLALPINRRHSIKLYGSTGLYTRTGTKFNIFGAVWQFRWGGGI